MKPHVLLSSAMSIDGYIDDTTPERLVLSNQEDREAVDRLRAESDAILVGPGTIRADNPKLLVRSTKLRQERVARHLPADLIKVTFTKSGNLDPNSRFFTRGSAEKIVYTPRLGLAYLQHLAAVATLASAGDAELNFSELLADLYRRGVHRLLIEGGTTTATLFLTQGLVDEWRVAVAPLIVGETAAPRLVHPAPFPKRPMRLASTANLNGMVVLTYTFSSDEN